jgi:hypothetical protein
MKKNIIIAVSVAIILVAILIVFPMMKESENKPAPAVKNTVTTDVVTDIKKDLEDIDFGSPEKDFEDVNKDIESL